MDVTDDRLYPYPQCEPPLVKDAADAPLNTRALAEAMDADFDTASAAVMEAYDLFTTTVTLTGPTSTGGTGLGEIVPFDVVEYDSQGWAELPGIRVADRGIYFMTAYANGAATDVQRLSLQFVDEASAFYLQGTSPPVAAFGQMTASGLLVVEAGHLLRVMVHYETAGAPTFTGCRFSVTRMVKL